MTSCLKSEVRRCRPLLGTFLEITASGGDEDKLNEAINAAFDSIERVQNLLSAHDPESELSRINREACAGPVTVSSETFTILKRAKKLAAESGGAFDCTVAPTLAQWDFLPADLKRMKTGDWRDLRLLPRSHVYFRQPLALDLGGIAKGFAVDEAIDVLRKRGVTSAVVNAGGDLRVFGPDPSVIHLRNPAEPQTFSGKVSIQNSALATSSPSFTEKNWRGRRVSHLVNPLKQTAVTGAISVSVRARKCWLADALTKVVLNSPDGAKTLLAKYNAEAFMVTA